MSQSATTPSLTNPTDGTNRSTKKPSETLRPHYLYNVSKIMLCFKSRCYIINTKQRYFTNPDKIQKGRGEFTYTNQWIAC